MSERAKEIRPFIVMDVLERAAELEQEGKTVIHLEVGEPDFNAPECVSEAFSQAFTEGRSHYTHSLGDPLLRHELALHYKREYRVDIDPGQIVITSGSSPALLLALGVLCNPGDEVILSNPGYACYLNFIRFIDAKAVMVPVYEEDGFQYRPDHICSRITERTRAILINSPMNPTGYLLSDEVMQQIAGFDIPIISDEIYHGLVYEGKARSMLEFTRNTFVVNGFSKLYAMTGLRLGYLVIPPEYVRPVQKLQQNLFICASSVAQRAGIAALKQAGPEVADMKKVYNQRRVYMLSRLRRMGFKIHSNPVGAFYIFVNARHISDDSFKLAFDILEKVQVGVAPGIDFGTNGEGYLRFSYANSLENIKTGMDRLEEYLSAYT